MSYLHAEALRDALARAETEAEERGSSGPGA
jgi:hypothetical protein